MNQKNIDTLRKAGYAIESGRLRRARALTPDTWTALPHGGFEGVILGGGQRTVRHRPAIRVNGDGTLKVECSCQDWRTRGEKASPQMPCKHILTLAFNVGDIPTVSPESDEAEAGASDAETPPPAAPDLPFKEKVRQAIGQAIEALADQVDALMQAGEIPFLLGPTGSGKTSAVRMVAQRRDWAFEEVAGSPSFADSDLVGLRTDHMEVPGVFARAFRRAREGETVLLFLDELTRFNARALDVLMRPLQVTPARIARAMGLAWGDIRLVEAPLWGQDWAPAEKVRIVLAANPWGSRLDPALVRRVHPLPAGFSEEKVLTLFTDPVKGIIQTSWAGTKNGEMPLPIEYQALLAAEGPDDQRIVWPYIERLRALDPAAADGFLVVAKGLGLEVT